MWINGLAGRDFLSLSQKQKKKKKREKNPPKPKLAEALFRKLPGNLSYSLTSNCGPFGAGPWLQKIPLERF